MYTIMKISWNRGDIIKTEVQFWMSIVQTFNQCKIDTPNVSTYAPKLFIKGYLFGIVIFWNGEHINSIWISKNFQGISIKR